MKVYCKFTVECGCKRILMSVNIWLSYRQESWLPHALSVSGHCPAERLRTRQVSWVWKETAFVALILTWLDNYETGVDRFCLANWHQQFIRDFDWTLMMCKRIFFAKYFLQRAQCSHCKSCTSYSNSVCLSVCPSVTHRYCVKTTARSTVQFAPLDSKMCLVL